MTAQPARCPHCGQQHEPDTLRCPSTAMPLPVEGRRLAGRYRFLSKLGGAAVYLGVDERADHEVTIKFPGHELGRDATDASQLRDPHICEILDLGDSELGPYVVMERLRGVDLGALIRRQTRLAPSYVVRIVRHALEGLSAAHAAGIVHRRLEPSSVFLHRTEAGATIVKLMDFGLQLDGGADVGLTVDIWAIGAILYRAITGQVVSTHPNVDPIAPLSTIVAGVPSELEAVIHRCLARDPSARFPSAYALSTALAPFEEIDVQVTLVPAPVVVPVAVEAPAVAIPVAVEPEPSEPMEIEPELIESEPEPEPEPDDIEVELEDVDEVDDAPMIDEPRESTEPQASVPSSAPLVEPPPAQPAKQVWLDQSAGTGIVKGEIEVATPIRSRKPNRAGRWIAAGAITVGVAVGGWVLFDQVGRDLLANTSTPEATKPEPTKPEPANATDSVTPSEPVADPPAVDPVPDPVPDPSPEPIVGETGAAEPVVPTEPVIEPEPVVPAEPVVEPEPVIEPEPAVEPEPATPRKPPMGTLRGGPYVTPRHPGPATDQATAIAHCAKLASESYAGIGDWKLADPEAIREFVGVEHKLSRYWTSGTTDGTAIVVNLPHGKSNPVAVEQKVARPLCISRY